MLLQFQARPDESSDETHEHGHRGKQDTGNLDDRVYCASGLWHVYGYCGCLYAGNSESNQSRLGKQKSHLFAYFDLRHAAVGFFDLTQLRNFDGDESPVGRDKRRICNSGRSVFLSRKGQPHKDVGRWPFPDFRFSLILEWRRTRLTLYNFV